MIFGVRLKVKAEMAQNDTELVFATRNYLLKEGSGLSRNSTSIRRKRNITTGKNTQMCISAMEQSNSPERKTASVLKRENTILSPTLARRRQDTQKTELGLSTEQSNFSPKIPTKYMFVNSSAYEIPRETSNLYEILESYKAQHKNQLFDNQMITNVLKIRQRRPVLSQYVLHPREGAKANDTTTILKSSRLTSNLKHRNLSSQVQLEDISLASPPINIHMESLIKLRPSTSMKNISYYNRVNKSIKPRLNGSPPTRNFINSLNVSSGAEILN